MKPWTPQTFVDERRQAHPGRALRMDYGGSKTVAIEEFCRQCEQTHRDVRACAVTSCPLFPFRPGADATDAVKRVAGVDVPSREWYEEELRKRDPDGSKAAAMRERMRGTGSVFDEMEEG